MDSLDEEEHMATTQKIRPKQEAVVNPVESKQNEIAASGKKKKKPSERKKEKKHKYTCNSCGSHMWFKTAKELNDHKKNIHQER